MGRAALTDSVGTNRMRSQSYPRYAPIAPAPDRARPAAVRSIPSPVYWLVALAIGSSFYVAVEPAPTDALFGVLLIVMLMVRGIRFPIDLNPILTTGLFAFLVGSAVSLLESREFGAAVLYLAITFYLVVSWYLVVTLLANYGWQMWDLILRAFLVAAVITAVIGLISHFSTAPQDYLGLSPNYGEERTRGTFKDPNVYAPFLTVALLLVVNQVVTGRWRLLAALPLLALFSLEILAAFSRGGYVNLAVCLLVFFALLIILGRKTQLRRFMGLASVALIVIVPVLVYFLQSTGLDEFLTRRLRFQQYDTERFAIQELALLTLGDSPFGIGPGQTTVVFPLATHNLYLRVSIENGLIALLGFFLFLAATLWVSLLGALRRGPFQDLQLSCLAILVGILVNSLVIDSLHWRHFFLFLAVPVGLAHYERWRLRPSTAAPAAATRS